MSGTRILARAAISLRRVVVLLETLMEQQWARELAQQPGVKSRLRWQKSRLRWSGR